MLEHSLKRISRLLWYKEVNRRFLHRFNSGFSAINGRAETHADTRILLVSSLRACVDAENNFSSIGSDNEYTNKINSFLRIILLR